MKRAVIAAVVALALVAPAHAGGHHAGGGGNWGHGGGNWGHQGGGNWARGAQGNWAHQNWQRWSAGGYGGGGYGDAWVPLAIGAAIAGAAAAAPQVNSCWSPSRLPDGTPALVWSCQQPPQ